MNVMTSPHSNAPPSIPSVAWLTNADDSFSFPTREVPYRWMTRQQVGSHPETNRPVTHREVRHDLRTMQWPDGQRADL